MATAGPVMAATQRPNDLHRYFPKPNKLERLFYQQDHVPKQRLSEPDRTEPVIELGVTNKETGSSQKKQTTKKDHQSTFALTRFRAKGKPVKSAPCDCTAQGLRVSVAGGSATADGQNQLRLRSSGAHTSCASVGCNCATGEPWLPIADHENDLRRPNFDVRPQNLPDKRGMVKRSVSAVTESTGRRGHSLSTAQSTVHPSCISGQRLSEWKDPSRFDVELGSDVISKRLSLHLVEQRPRTPSGKSNGGDQKDTKGAASAISEVLTVLGGPPYVRQGVDPPTDRSPLIELDKPSFAAAKNSFDNVAATENSSDSRHPGQSNQSGADAPHGTTHPQLHPGVSKFDAEPVHTPAVTPRQPSTPRSIDTKKKRWFPALRVRIPEDEDHDIGPKLNIKKLSAADERKIEEVLELAETFGRLGTDHCPSTPRTPGASSKESKESLTGSSDSPTSHFLFNFLKGRKEEKKTFVEELASHLTDPSSLLTPEALEAYEKLVSMHSNEAIDASTKNRPSKQLTRQAHRSSLRTKLLQRIHPQRNSLSESDKDIVPENSLQKKSPKTGHSKLMRFGSTGGTLMSQKAPSEQDLFAWFDRSPLNTTRSERTGRPKSLQSDFGSFGSRSNAFPLSMPCRSPGIQLPPRGGREKKVESFRRVPPPPPSASEDLDKPPAIPPRIPHRHSTVNASSQPKIRKNHVPSGDKQRSYSEGVSTTNSMRFNLYDVPRRHVRSTDTSDGASLSFEPQSPNSRSLSNALHGSDDSVFDHHIPRSPLGTTPQTKEQPLGSSRGAKNRGPYRSMSVKNVKVNAKELGISDKNDPFWKKNVNLDLSESHSESDLLREALAPIPGRYETSDCISYEDLMEFALDGPQHCNRSNNVDSTICDEIRLMRKMFSNDVTIDDCMEALVETSWNVLHAVKLIKLKQLLGTGLGSQDQCKDALMACNWNVDEAATFLLAPLPGH